MLFGFCIYLISGALLLGLMRLVVYWTSVPEEASELVQLARQMSKLKPKTWRAHILSWTIYPLVWIVWPLGVLIAVQALLKQRGIEWNPFPWEKSPKHSTADFEDKFICQPADLVEAIEPVKAEATSFVKDPLGQVPNLPFGHLHEGWSHLLSQLEPTDTLWRFKSPKRGWQEACSGYAVVRQRQVIAEFIYERHPL